MSQYFNMGDETVWNPSNGVSQLFMSQVDVFCGILGVPSGISPMHSDECEIDPRDFKVFVDALLNWNRRTKNVVATALSEGFVITALALAERAGIEVNRPSIEAVPDDASQPVRVYVVVEGFGQRATTLSKASYELSRLM
ncbi:DUF6086 family protein [Streptomyces sp. NPDC094448]|uniref:DUF6086 family protein n=1 Tax=Streptomyces sp. NPDC094448 TaxID=3366063 RepID=UPI00381AAADA